MTNMASKIREYVRNGGDLGPWYSNLDFLSAGTQNGVGSCVVNEGMVLSINGETAEVSLEDLDERVSRTGKWKDIPLDLHRYLPQELVIDVHHCFSEVMQIEKFEQGKVEADSLSSNIFAHYALRRMFTSIARSKLSEKYGIFGEEDNYKLIGFDVEGYQEKLAELEEYIENRRVVRLEELAKERMQKENEEILKRRKVEELER
ncbi:MAG: hypothetical protein IJS68_01805 [Clostridia bacterium]|nr:hypothetical protein [Clostridia bacterium]